MRPAGDWIGGRPTRAALLLAAVSAACAVAVAGSSSTAGAAPSAKACQILVVMDPAWTKPELRRVLAVARATPHVVRATFVSKKAALAAFRKQFPDLVRNLNSNPLPDSVHVVPDAASAMRGIGARLAAAHLRGVATIKVPPVLLGVPLC